MRTPAAANHVSASACTPPVVDHTAGMPAASAATTCSTADAASEAWIATPMVPVATGSTV